MIEFIVGFLALATIAVFGDFIFDILISIIVAALVLFLGISIIYCFGSFLIGSFS